MSTQHHRTAAASAANRAAGDVGRRLRAGDVDLAAVLVALDTDAEAVRQAVSWVTVDRLLRYVPGIGPASVVLVCRKARVDRGTRVGDLDPIRRARLADQLRRFDVRGYSGNGYVRRVR